MIHDSPTVTRLYFEMLRIRRVEEAIVREYPKGAMRCPTHIYIGQEAVAAGVCAALSPGDVVFSNHRSHGHYLAKGGDLRAMIAELYGKATGCSRGWGGSQHLVDLSANFWGSTPIVAGTIPVAVGVGFAIQRLSPKLPRLPKENAFMESRPGGSTRRPISVVFFGEAAMEEGVAHESLNVAVLKNLPILFVCENNLYSVNTHLWERQPPRALWKLAAAHGMHARCGDGNDAESVYAITSAAAARIRNGRGPAFLEFATYRYREHCGPNPDHPAIRPTEEVEEWHKKDPLLRFDRRIRRDERELMEEKIEKEIDAAFSFAKKSPWPQFRIRK